MIIIKKSSITGILHQMNINITENEYIEFVNDDKALVQEKFPNLSPGEREFLISGIHPREWEQLFNNINN